MGDQRKQLLRGEVGVAFALKNNVSFEAHKAHDRMHRDQDTRSKPIVFQQPCAT